MINISIKSFSGLVRGIIAVMVKYPIFLELAGRRVLIVGGGTVAARKAESVLKAGARLVVVAERVNEALRALCTANKAELIESKYSKDYLVGATLAIAATNNVELNTMIYKDCQQLEILCNVVDSPGLCDFYVPAVVNRGDLQIAVGTDGKSPAFAGHIRKKLEKIFTNKHGEFLAELERLRTHIIKTIPDDTERKSLLGKLADDESFDYFVKNGAAEWRKKAEQMMKSSLRKQ
jgi:precorrin-2 dehydrogenase/sirohydrochlorin ferrochelatase